MFRRNLTSLLLAVILPIGTASAVPITMQFTATGFPSGAPDSTVSGIIKWEAASSPTDPVQNFTSVDLKIAGIGYSLNDIAFAVDPNNSNLFEIGGALNGIFGLNGNTNDFIIAWLVGSPPTPQLFEYATTVPQGGGPFLTRTFDSFSVTADATNGTEVPVPATGVLLVLALGSLALMRRHGA